MMVGMARGSSTWSLAASSTTRPPGTRVRPSRPAGRRARRARMAHTPYCHRGESLSRKRRFAASSTAAATDRARV